MVITEVRIKLMEDNNERLLAFCSVTFDDAFVVRDLKIIEGSKGSFVAMPSRKLTDRCGQCGYKNHLRARYCNQCGYKLNEDRAIRDATGRAKLHADIAHPINSACREVIQNAVLRSYHEERERAKQPGYVCHYDDLDGDCEEGFVPAASDRSLAARPGIDETVRAHPGHVAPSRRHANGHESAAPACERSGEHTGGFGAGIL